MSILDLAGLRSVAVVKKTNWEAFVILAPSGPMVIRFTRASFREEERPFFLETLVFPARETKSLSRCTSIHSKGFPERNCMLSKSLVMVSMAVRASVVVRTSCSTHLQISTPREVRATITRTSTVVMVMAARSSIRVNAPDLILANVFMFFQRSSDNAR